MMCCSSGVVKDKNRILAFSCSRRLISRWARFGNVGMFGTIPAGPVLYFCWPLFALNDHVLLDTCGKNAFLAFWGGNGNQKNKIHPPHLATTQPPPHQKAPHGHRYNDRRYGSTAPGTPGASRGGGRGGVALPHLPRPALQTRREPLRTYILLLVRTPRDGGVARGCHIGYMDHIGCHQLVLLTTRPTRVVTRVCQNGYVDRTDCHHLVF
jgi:hypothetical protein